MEKEIDILAKSKWKFKINKEIKSSIHKILTFWDNKNIIDILKHYWFVESDELINLRNEITKLDLKSDYNIFVEKLTQYEIILEWYLWEIKNLKINQSIVKSLLKAHIAYKLCMDDYFDENINDIKIIAKMFWENEKEIYKILKILLKNYIINN